MSLIITKDKYPEIIELYNNGKKQSDIAKLYGVDQTTISLILRKCGIKDKFNGLRTIQFSEYDKIVELYNNGLLQREIAEIYGVKQCCISNILTTCGVISRRTISKEKEHRVIDMYVSGMTQIDIMKTTGISTNSITEILNKNNIQRRTASEISRVYNFNEHYFDIIDTPNKAYFLGILYADGCNHKNNMITLSLQERDRDILEKLNKEIQNERPLRYQKSLKEGHQSQYVLTFGSPYISQKLCELGCVHAKSLILKYPMWLDSNLHSHFLRGYFDGDGSISRFPKKMSASFVGTYSFCVDAAKIIDQQCGIHYKIYIYAEHENGDATAGFQIGRKADACIFLDYIYKDAELYIQRKYDIYQTLYCHTNINNRLLN